MKKFVLFLMVLLMLVGLTSKVEGKMISDKLTRLHVIANSNSEEDQSLKLKVRDAVLEYAGTLYSPDGTLTSGELENIRLAAEAEIYRNGYSYPVNVLLGDEHYNTRVYDTFSLPVGTYNSLRVVIGEGAGENWWCVLFPPLCGTAATATDEDIETIAKAAGFTEDEIALISEKDGGYVLRFKCVEWFEKLLSLFDK